MLEVPPCDGRWLLVLPAPLVVPGPLLALLPMQPTACSMARCCELAPLLRSSLKGGSQLIRGALPLPYTLPSSMPCASQLMRGPLPLYCALTYCWRVMALPPVALLPVAGHTGGLLLALLGVRLASVVPDGMGCVGSCSLLEGSLEEPLQAVPVHVAVCMELPAVVLLASRFMAATGGLPPPPLPLLPRQAGLVCILGTGCPRGVGHCCVCDWDDAAESVASGTGISEWSELRVWCGCEQMLGVGGGPPPLLPDAPGTAMVLAPRQLLALTRGDVPAVSSA